MKSSLEWIEASEDQVVKTLISLSSIISPSGNETDRAHFIAERMREIGLKDVSVDEIFNVTGRIKGISGKAIVFVTMLDDLPEIGELQKTGFHATRKKDRVLGPATEIQSCNAAVLLGAEAIVRSGIIPEHDIVFASVAQEELALVGMKVLFDKLKDQTIAWVEVLGDGEKIVYGAPYLHWWKIIAYGKGGHTGDPSPNVNLGISRAVSSILTLPFPKQYDNTFINVGIIQSGNLYNHKPKSGWFSLDIRSTTGQTVQNIESEVKNILKQVKEETDIRLEMEKVAIIDGRQLPGASESRLVILAEEISKYLGNKPDLSSNGCCNMMIPISQGQLAIGLHGDVGGQRATAEEWASIPAMIKTAKFVVLLATNF